MFPSARWLLVLTCLAACRDPAPSAYVDLIALDAPDVTVHLAECRALALPNEAGDCELVIARKAAEVAGAAPTAWCGDIQAPAWRDECWFLGAEDLLRARQIEAAVDACLMSGRFIDECAQHLWQHELYSAAGKPGPVDVMGQVSRARAVYDKWHARLGAQTDIDVRLWRKYFGLGFEHHAVLDPRACGSLDAVDRARCEQTVAWLFAQRLLDQDRRLDDTERLCAAAPTVEGVTWAVRGLNTRPHPVLDPVVAELLPRICDSTPAALDDDGVVGDAAFRAAVAAAERAATADPVSPPARSPR